VRGFGVCFLSRECLFHELDYSLRLPDKIAVLLGVYKLHNLAIGDCSSDLSGICSSKSRDFDRISASCIDMAQPVGWLTSFNSNHTPHAGTLPSTGHC